MSIISMKKIMLLGRYCFAVAVIASGVQQLVTGHFVRLVPPLPSWISWPSLWAYLVGAALIVAGLLILSGKMPRLATTVLGAMFVATFVFQRVPEILSNPSAGFVWTNPCKVLTLLGGAIILAATLPDENPRGFVWTRKLLPMGSIFLGLFLVLCGVQHFVYADFVVTLVPGWIPPGRLFWAYFAGVALIGGGVGVLVPATVRWAGTLSGLMILLWVPLLHIPKALANPRDPGETSAIFEALALSGVAFLVAGGGRFVKESNHALPANGSRH